MSAPPRERYEALSVESAAIVRQEGHGQQQAEHRGAEADGAVGGKFVHHGCHQ